MIDKRDIKLAVKTMRYQIGLSPLQLQSIIMENGLIWLDKVFSHNEQEREVWQKSQIFWSWWENQWELETLEILKCWGFVSGELHDISERRKSRLQRAYPKAHKNTMSRFPPYLLSMMIAKREKSNLLIHKS